MAKIVWEDWDVFTYAVNRVNFYGIVLPNGRSVVCNEAADLRSIAQSDIPEYAIPIARDYSLAQVVKIVIAAVKASLQ